MGAPFKMKGFSGFGNSPMKQIKVGEEGFKARQASKLKGKEFVKNLKTKGDLATKAKTNIKPDLGLYKKAKLKTNVATDFKVNLKKGKDALSRTAKGFGNTTKQLAKGAKQALKIGGRLAGGLGIAAMGYDAYKSGQKHSGGKAVKGQKSFMAGAKKKTKSIYNKK
jgi:hypothetical protein